MSEKIDLNSSITKGGGRLEAGAHEVHLDAIASNTFSLGGIADNLTTEQKFYVLKRLDFDNLESLEDLPPSAVFMLERVQELDINEAEAILIHFLEEHEGDVNIPIETYDFVERLVKHKQLENLHGIVNLHVNTSDSKTEKGQADIDATRSFETEDAEGSLDLDLKVRTEAAIFAYWSPYPEVRAVTDPFDDPDIPCETFRVYVIGIIWVVLGTIIGEFFTERQPSISLGSAAVQLFVYPSGKLLEYVLPKKTINIWRWKIDLNPGPWSHKEQMLATLCYSVSGGAVYATYFINLQKLDIFYNNLKFTIGAQFLIVLASNFMGFGLAGIFRKFVVYPVFLIWPTILPTLAVNRSLVQPEKKENIHGWRISRYAFFLTVFAASFIYFWIPDYLFTALSTFNWISWAAPNSLNVATITGSQTGLGLNPITTFDWNNILGSPLALPFFTQVNNYIGMLIGFFAIVGLWWTNYKWTAYLPINSNSIFTNTGKRYSVTSVLNSQGKLDQDKYERVGPPFYSAANLVAYGAFFAVYPMNFFYVVFSHWRQLKFALVGIGKSFNFKVKRSTYEGFDDPFSVSMKKYPEVPEWWFVIILLISLVFSIVNVEVYDLQTPVWTIFFALALNLVFLLPFCIVYAATGTSMSINVLLEMIIGYALPGNGTALNFVKTLGTNIDSQAENYITNQKQAHYWRIPPRSLFRVQMVSVLINSLLAVGILNLAISSISDYCHPRQPQKFTCPGTTTFYSASVIWGVIGPKKIFGGLYPVMQYTFLIGFLVTIPCWALKRYYGKTVIGKYLHPVVITLGMIGYAPYNLSYYTPALYLSIAFMYVIRKRYTAWWEKYNYTLAGGLNGGIAFSSIIIFFAVQYHTKTLSWWGNDVNDNILDATAPSRLNVTTDAPDGYFGPRIGHFP